MNMTESSFRVASVPRDQVISHYFGALERDAASEIHLPLGIPGFESETRMVAVEIPEQRPLLYLQSGSNPELCFLTLPVQEIDGQFQLELSEEERITLRLDEEEPLIIGENVLALAILFPVGSSLQVNLAAPLVLNLRAMTAVQCLPQVPESNRRLQLGDSGIWEALC